MRAIIIICLFFLTCKTQKKYEEVEIPSKTELDYYGRIKPGDGPENSKRMKYYNSLQHKKFYSKKIPSK